MGSFEGKVALVTGGGSGIGQAAALAFARRGATVVITGRRAEAGAETVRLIEAEGCEGTFIQADVTKEAEVKALIDQIIQRFGRLDYAFNNAGGGSKFGSMVDMTEADWTESLDSNLKSVWLSLKYELPQIAKQGGAIVNNASVVAQRGQPMTSFYAAAKAAVVSLTKSAAIEFAPKGVRVNAVSPAIIETAMTERLASIVSGGATSDPKAQFGANYPLGRVGEPREIADAVVWLCSDEASFVTAQEFTIDGGVMER
ncbi:MAG: glucose 1-dehydrogenase [Chloroflexi bacterium]|nr:glucose 1-dehydrogenase [Chloroflexota bacterium]